MNRRTKLHGFTLAEIIVVMVISSLVILSGYMVYYFVSTQMHNYKTQSQEFLKVHELISLMGKDICLCDKVLLEDASVEMMNSDGVIEYHFQGDYIIREQKHAQDTFNIILTSPAGSMLSELVRSGMIDLLSFEIRFGKKVYSVSFFKQYAACELFDLEQIVQEQKDP